MYTHGMTHSREILEVMDSHTTFGRKSGCRISRCGGFLLGSAFFLGLVTTGLLVFHFAPCLEGKTIKSNESFFGSGSLQTIKLLSEKNKQNVRLPKSIVPDSYELKLIPFIWEGNFTFNGEVKILINVTEETQNVTLHAADLTIDEASTSIKEYDDSKNEGIKPLKIDSQLNDTAKQLFIIKTSEILVAGKQYNLYINFVGKLNDYLQGFYRSSYKVDNKTRWIATTQFEPTDARRAFPCFDEPALKASFQISIARPKNMSSISNMPQKGKSEPVSGLDSYEWDHFERSVPMSTYLVAFTVFDFKFLKSADGNFRVWARSEAIDQAKYSLSIGPKILKHYEDFFQIKFPLPKIDMVALPDFSAGAMENWGLITYRETAMLYQEGVSSNRNKQRVASVVAHELAHQWFGNLVTPSWWSDLWLNEGFASYVENIGVNSAEPDWMMLDQFVVNELQNVLTLDALVTSHPISVEVGNPEQINEIFDRISYDKGSSLIRMMDHYLTTDVFRQGLTNYLSAKAYSNAEQNDLWDALTEQAHKDKVLEQNVTVKEIMDTWTLQTGFPVVTVTRDYKNGGASLTQERFTFESGTSSESSPRWWIPITFTTQEKLDFNKTKPMHWMKAEKSITIPDLGAKPSQWIIFNIQETGYYRVNYDPENWQMLIKYLNQANFKDISTINRAQLIDDAFRLAAFQQLNYTIALDVTSYLVNETEYFPWKSALTALGSLDHMLSKCEDYDRFRIYALKILDNIYKQTGFKDSYEDKQLTVFTRIIVLHWACLFGHEDCVRNAVKQFMNWRNSPNPKTNNPISPNLKSVVYCTAIRVGGQAEWDFAWQQYLETNVGSEKDLLLLALGCSRESWILTRYLDWALKENSGIRKQDITRVFRSVASNNIGQPMTFNYLRNNWNRIREYIGSSFMTISSIVEASTNRLTSKYELKDLLEFVNDHAKEFGSATRVVQQAVERTENNIKWLERNNATIIEWLKRNTA